jgi:hypothetical protein
MNDRSGGVRGALLGVLVLFLTGFICQGAVKMTLLSPERQVGPSEFVTHVFSVQNDSDAPDVFDLEIGLPSDWMLLEAPAILALRPGQEEVLFVTAIVGPQTRAGEYAMRLRVISRNTAEQVEITAGVEVKPVNAVGILTPSGETVVPGQDLVYPVTLVNRGNAQDTYRLAAESSNRLPVRLSQDLIGLAPQERVTIEVRLSVPIDFSPGSDIITLSATSTLYPGVSAKETISSTILPPPPQAVGRTLMEELPARLRFSLSHDLSSSLLCGDLAFSFSGRVETGTLSFSLNASPLFGPDPLDVTSFSIRYHRSPTSYTIGDTFAGLSDLLNLSCRGGSATLDTDYYDITVICGGYAEEETRAGGRLTLGPDVANAGIAYMEERSQSDQSAVWSLIAETTPLEDWSLRLEGAIGFENQLTSRALFLNTTVNTSSYFLSANAFSVGSYFPGSHRDQAGLTLSQRLRQQRFSLGLSLEHTWTNVIRDPLVPTRLTDKLGVNLSVTPFEIGPTLSTTTEFVWNRRDDPSLESAVNRLLGGTLADSRGNLPYSFSARLFDQIDHVAGTYFRTLSFSEEIGASVEGFDLSFKLTQERRENPLTEELLSGGSDVSLTFKPKGSLHSATLMFANDRDNFDLSLRLGVKIIKDLNINFSGSLRWDRTDTTPATLHLGLEFNFTFDLPIPFLVTKGQIEGRAFVDNDENGRFSAGDREVGEIVIASRRSEVSTDNHGFFRFPPFYPGTYELTVRNLPFDAAPPKVPVSVELRAGQTVAVDLPLVPVLYVEGNVFDDADQNGMYTEGEGGVEQVFLNLRAEDGTAKDTYTDKNGRFRFLNVLPGRYTLSINPLTLPARFAFTTPEEVTLQIVGEAPPPVRFGGYIKPKEVVITFQPPTAEFILRPEQPKAGWPVTFDASDSFALVGTIVSYEWDFDGDRFTDATGISTTYTFPSPKSVDVTLTVTDDRGNSDAITYTIHVK